MARCLLATVLMGSPGRDGEMAQMPASEAERGRQIGQVSETWEGS